MHVLFRNWFSILLMQLHLWNTIVIKKLQLLDILNYNDVRPHILLPLVSRTETYNSFILESLSSAQNKLSFWVILVPLCMNAITSWFSMNLINWKCAHFLFVGFKRIPLFSRGYRRCHSFKEAHLQWFWWNRKISTQLILRVETERKHDIITLSFYEKNTWFLKTVFIKNWIWIENYNVFLLR